LESLRTGVEVEEKEEGVMETRKSLGGVEIKVVEVGT